MPRLTDTQRNNAIGRLQAGATQQAVATHFGVSRHTIAALWARFNNTQSVHDRPRSGRPRVTSAARIVTSGSAIFGIAPRQQHRQHPKSLDCKEFPIKLFATASEKQDFWPEDQCDGTR
ncbi:hypothetical protein BaRGS_00040044 [Batillaria attramentaria]|uniref:Insertion element IS150 protein InsJ-like helix-turn-helix domain-containing protein n=1 Tax=Batillaria attramentaria TaxID=370345 RepID=A0ABD0J1F1_9CAEN